MRDIFTKWQTTRLHGHLIWIPMLSTDTLDAALAQETLNQDKRVFHYWDGERALGRLVAQTLGLAAPVAWDIYLLYSPPARWEGQRLPAPDFWMHQLDEQPDLRLDPARLASEVQAMLIRSEL